MQSERVSEKIEKRTIQASALGVGNALRPKLGPLPTLLRFARHKPLGAIAGLIIVAFIVMATTAPLLSPYDPLAQDGRNSFKPPDAIHLLGTDQLGRDVLSRIIYGSRISLWVGIVAVGIGTISGSAIGIVSGYFGGKVDFATQRLMDTLMAFPALILAIAIMAVLGTSITNAMLAIAIVLIPGASRVVRGSTLTTKENQYVEAARAVGCRDARILLSHILPNVLAPIIVIATIGLGSAIIAEASLSFLGLGTPPPNPSWGSMLSGSSRIHMQRAPWTVVFPGLAITLVVLGFNLLGDALRDVLDPRLKQA